MNLEKNVKVFVEDLSFVKGKVLSFILDGFKAIVLDISLTREERKIYLKKGYEFFNQK